MKISIKGVLLGGICDLVATNVLALPFVIFVIDRFDLGGKSLDSATIAALIHEHAPLYAVQILIGLVCSILGGYITARIAKHDELLNGTLSSYLCLGIGIYSLMTGKDSITWLVRSLLLLAAPACGLLGGYLRVATKPRST